MKYLRGGVLALLSSILFANSSFAAVLETIEPPIEYYAEAYITAFQVSAVDEHSSQLDAVEIHNPGSELVTFDGWAIEAYDEYGSICRLSLTDAIEPDGYVVLARAGLFEAAAVRQFSPDCWQEGRIIASLHILDSDGKSEVIGGFASSGAWVRKNTTKTYRSGLFSKDFEVMDESSRTTLYAGEWYVPPVEVHVEVVEILARAADCSPLLPEPRCGDYVKLYNPTTQPLSLDGLRLRIGHAGQNPTTSNAIILTGELQPGSYGAITTKADGSELSITNDGGWIWLEDTYGIMRYDNTVVEYPSASSETKIGWAWMYDDVSGEWAWTARPTAGGTPSELYVPVVVIDSTSSSSSSALKPCGPGQFRNPETNRCKKIESSTDALKPCAPGEFRNPATNRCKKIATATSASLKPCGPGQYRNPETNRCKSLASAESQLEPCDEGYERNPETNRCRKVLSASTTIPATAFAVEPYSESTRAMASWWVLGLITLFGLGYAVWEWRFELKQWVQQFAKIKE